MNHQLSESFLEFQQVSRTYGTGESEVRALDQVSFQMETGEFVALMGPSGSGKSTCLNIMGGLDVPSAGKYLLHNEEVGTLSLKRKALLRRRQIGFIFQSFNLLGRTSAVENVELPLIYQRTPMTERRERALSALEQVGLSHRINHTPAELSGGQKQRVAIARALVGQPSLILADEPTGNLDSTSSMEIMELLMTLNQQHQVAIVLVTHEYEMSQYAQRTIRFLDGQILSIDRNG